MPAPPYPVRLLADLPFAEPGGVQLLADLYLPDDAPRPLPVLVWLHGGGWRYGDRSLAPDLSRYFAQAASRCSRSNTGYRRRHSFRRRSRT